MTDNERFCAICERRLGVKDSEYVCRSCFRKARQPKDQCIYVSDRAARTIGTAIAVGNFVNWGVQRLVDALGVKVPPPPKTREERERLVSDARKRLADIQKRLKEQLDQADSDGGPETTRS